MELMDLSFIWLEILDLRCQKWFMSAKKNELEKSFLWIKTVRRFKYMKKHQD